MVSVSNETIPPAIEGCNLPAAEHFAHVVQNYALGVLRVQGPRGVGTGCLIGGNLLITNYHVIANEEEALKSRAKIWYVSEATPNQRAGTITWRDLKIEGFFHSSKNLKQFDIPQPADGNHLDYAIVVLENDFYLSTIQDYCLSLINDATLIPKQEICIIHHPDKVDDKNQVQGDRRRTLGTIRVINKFTILHDAPAAEGSSGGAIINREGEFIALHHQGEEAEDGVRRDFEYAVLTSKIEADLQRHKKLEELERKIDASKKALAMLAPLDAMQHDRYVDCPLPSRDFTGRNVELERLDAVLSTARVAVTGLGGIGKTALVLKYVELYQNRYKVIQYIRGFDDISIQDGLIKFARNQGIFKEDCSTTLKKLQRYLTRHRDCLLIFDGVNTEEGFAFLESFLPSQMLSIIITTRMPDQGHYLLGCASIPLMSFNEVDALAFIEKMTDQTERALELAETLGFLPLAISHACAYIGKNFRINTFLQRFRIKQTALLGTNIPRPTREQTILTTWNVSLGMMSPITIELFMCCAYLGDADIPEDFIEEWIKNCQPNGDAITCIRELIAYSMMKSTKPDQYTIHELVKHVIRDQQRTQMSLCECIKTAVSYIKRFDYDHAGGWRGVSPMVPHIVYLFQRLSFEMYQNMQEEAHITLPDYSEVLEPLVFIYHHNGQYEKIIEKLDGCETKMMTLKTLACYANAFIKLKRYNEGLIYYFDLLLRKLDLVNQDIKNGVLLLVFKKTVLQTEFIESIVDKFVCETENEREIVIQIVGNIENLANAYSKKGFALQHSDSITRSQNYYAFSYEVKKKFLGYSHQETCKAMDNLGVFYGESKDYIRAIELHEKARCIRRSLNIENLNYAEGLNNLGQIYCLKGIEESKEDLIERGVNCIKDSLEVKKKVLGDENLIYIRSLREFGRYLGSVGRYQDAEENQLEAIKLAKRAHPENLSFIAKCYSDCGFRLKSSKNYNAALDYFRRSIDIRMRLSNERHLLGKTYFLHGCVLEAQGREVMSENREEACEMCRKALNSYKHALRLADKSEIATEQTIVKTRSLTEFLIRKLYEIGCVDEVLLLLNEWIVIIKKASEDSLESTAAIEYNYLQFMVLKYNVLIHAGRFEEAKRYLEEIKEIQLKFNYQKVERFHFRVMLPEPRVLHHSLHSALVKLYYV